ncbi:hypothetical protein CSAL01_06537 [Colletotrichum salicis]|uniref:Uncharacterized protein n=1 Tax=Colletotrichum salicis TaxID=1209931 RepID=A0A135V3C8_9PEZI|nr:hypothetical protein CSAL01_06537 [Colletotrichum salicis]
MCSWLPDYPGLGHRDDGTSRSPPQQQEPDDPPPAYEEIQMSPARDAHQETPIIESVTFGLSTWPDSTAPYMVLNTHQPSHPEKKRMDIWSTRSATKQGPTTSSSTGTRLQSWAFRLIASDGQSRNI